MISILPTLAGAMVLNFENDSTQKCVHHVSYDIYKHNSFFGHHRYHNQCVLRVGRIYNFYPLKKNRTPNKHFAIQTSFLYLTFAGAFKQRIIL